MARIEQAVEINKEVIVNVRTLQFNYKLWAVTTQEKNLPLPTVVYDVPLAYSWWNITKPGGDQITQMLWENNFTVPRHSAQCVLVKRFAVLMPAYMIHRLSQMVRCDKELTEFDGCHACRRYIAKDRPFWSTIQSLEEDLLAMADRYTPAWPLRMNGDGTHPCLEAKGLV